MFRFLCVNSIIIWSQLVFAFNWSSKAVDGQPWKCIAMGSQMLARCNHNFVCVRNLWKYRFADYGCCNSCESHLRQWKRGVVAHAKPLHRIATRRLKTNNTGLVCALVNYWRRTVVNIRRSVAYRHLVHPVLFVASRRPNPTVNLGMLSNKPNTLGEYDTPANHILSCSSNPVATTTVFAHNKLFASERPAQGNIDGQLRKYEPEFDTR